MKVMHTILLFGLLLGANVSLGYPSQLEESIRDNFHMLNCTLDAFGSKVAEWLQGCGPIKFNANMYCSVQSYGIELSLVLYLYKKSNIYDTFSCNGNYWKVAGDKISEGSEIICPSEEEEETNLLTSISRELGLPRIIEYSNLIAKDILSFKFLTIFIVYFLFLLQVFFMSSKIITTSSIYAEMAFIVEYGQQVQTLDKLKNDYIKPPPKTDTPVTTNTPDS